MKRVVAGSPTRIDFAGGTLDIWPLNLLVARALTVNVAIDLVATCEIEDDAGAGQRVIVRSEDHGLEETWDLAAGPPATTGLPLVAQCVRWIAPDRGFRITTRSGSPPGAGLGGSSALAISILGALEAFLGRPMTPPRERIMVARDLEARILRIPTGTQDHYAASFGGAAAIHLGPGRPRREPLSVDLDRLGERLVMVHAGASRVSADANWDMMRRAIDGDEGTGRALEAVAGIALRMREAFVKGDLDAIGPLMEQEWEARRALSPRVSTDLIERAITVARAEGAQAAKVCGAGGGGCVVFWCPVDRREAIARALGALEEHGVRVIPARPTSVGLQVG